MEDLRADDDDDDDEVAEGDSRQPLVAMDWEDERDADAIREVENSSKKRQKFLLQQMLSAGTAEPASDLADGSMYGESAWKMKIVDVNRVSKGVKAGSMMRYSALIVVGNANGVLGYGSGKAADTNAAVRKAYVRATRNLTFVPRFHGHTVHYPITTFMGKTKLIMIPRSSGTGVTASRMMSAICKLAGIHNVMIKIQGSRNIRNSVHALFKAFDDMQLRLANV